MREKIGKTTVIFLSHCLNAKTKFLSFSSQQKVQTRDRTAQRLVTSVTDHKLNTQALEYASIWLWQVLDRNIQLTLPALMEGQAWVAINFQVSVFQAEQTVIQINTKQIPLISTYTYPTKVNIKQNQSCIVFYNGITDKQENSF